MVDVLLYGDLVDPFFPVAPEEDDECLPEDRATRGSPPRTEDHRELDETRKKVQFTVVHT
ncbi:hypothetical protein GBAR_LOCUS12776, partial [Geodia barretti]